MAKEPIQSALEKPSFIESLGNATSHIAARVVPEPFVLAIVLSFLTLFLGVLFGPSVGELPFFERGIKVGLEGWYAGLFGSGGLAFAFQMIFVLVTGHALALSPPVQRIISFIAKIPRSAAQASAVVALFACASAFIHWGLGAVAGAMLAREIGRAWAKEGRRLHYPLLGAAAYSGLLVWHGGLSGSAPLKISEEGHFLEAVTGVVSTSETIFAFPNLLITGSLFLLCGILYFFLTPRDPTRLIPYDPKQHGGGEVEASPMDPSKDEQLKLVGFLEQGVAVPIAVLLLAGGVIVRQFVIKGGSALDLNLVNLGFFAMGLAFHGSPKNYLNAASEGAKGTVGIVLQFPLYFAILGMLKASGLIEELSAFFVTISTQNTLPIFIYLSAGLVNLLVPSGGGQWAVQGPVMMSAANTLGVDPAKAVMALAYGDAWTNMLQPFWALPLLGITGLKARDIIGYTTLIFLASGPLVMFWLLIL